MRDDVKTEALAADALKCAIALHIVLKLLMFHRNSIIVAMKQMYAYLNAIKKELYAEYFGLDKYYLRCGKFGSYDYHCNPAKETK